MRAGEKVSTARLEMQEICHGRLKVGVRREEVGAAHAVELSGRPASILLSTCHHR